MKPRAIWLAAAVAGTLVWVASPELRWPARLFASVLLGPAPIAFMFQARAADAIPRPLPRTAVYVGSMIALSLLALTALSAGMLSGFTTRLMGLVNPGVGSLLMWTAVLLVAAGLVVTAFKWAGAQESAIMREIVPVTPKEKLVFCALALTAGVCEEIAFRGFLIPALDFATGSTIAAVVLSSAAFGVLHAHQHASGALRAAILGAVLAIPFVITGSVYASMAAHTLVDVMGGLWLARWLIRS